jgi:hypothetical protein
MKRFLLVLALVAVAGATYVATAPGSQTAGPTARQFRALKSQVNHLKTQINHVKTELGYAENYELGLGDFLLTCMVHAPIAVNSVGDASNGYLFGAPGTPPASATSTSALALDSSGTPAYAFFTVNLANQDCVDFINSVAGRHALKRLGAFAGH